jgi:flagellin
MGMRINTNVNSLAARRTLGNTTKAMGNTLTKMSSGERITAASDDAAGLAISEKLKANIRSMDQAKRNANDGISMIQTSEGGLNEISSILIRLRELSVQSASDTQGETEREFSNLEYQNLKKEIERISQVTEYNGTKLLNGKEQKLDFQIGVNNVDFEDRVKYNTEKLNSTLDSLAIGDLEVTTKESSQTSLGSLDKAISHIAGQRAELGALQNRLNSTINNLNVTGENLSAANSRVRDADYASITSENTKLSILQSAGTSVLAQSNQQAQSALKLVG